MKLPNVKTKIKINLNCHRGARSLANWVLKIKNQILVAKIIFDICSK